MKFLVLPGDGIGPEIVASAVDALEALDRRYGLKIELDRHEVGFASLERTGSTLPPEVMALATQVDGVLLGPVSTEDYPPLEKGGINPSSWFRKQLDLYANIRPSYVRPGVPCHAADMDLVIVRENTEGFYADRNMAVGSGEFMPTPDVALAIGKLTTEGCRRIAVTAFELARRRRRASDSRAQGQCSENLQRAVPRSGSQGGDGLSRRGAGHGYRRRHGGSSHPRTPAFRRGRDDQHVRRHSVR